MSDMLRIVRDNDGKINSWVDGDVEATVNRSPAGDPLAVVFRAPRTAQVVIDFLYANGYFIGTNGHHDSPLLQTIISEVGGARIGDTSGFTSSSFGAPHLATSTAQAQTNAQGATKLFAQNLDANNDAYIGFGMSESEARDACDNGKANVDRFLLFSSKATGFAGIPVNLRIGKYTHHAYKGNGLVLIGQGV